MRGGDWGENRGEGGSMEEVGKKGLSGLILQWLLQLLQQQQLCEFCCLPCSSYVEKIHTGYIKNA